MTQKQYNRQASNGFQQNLDLWKWFIIITNSPEFTALFVHDVDDTFTCKIVPMF
jgi:hypothetical protein